MCDSNPILHMPIILRKTRFFIKMLSNAQFKDIWGIIKHRTYSNTYSYLVRRDLTIGLDGPIPKAKINIKLREYRASDHKYFNHLPLDDMLLKANIPTCYVAVTDEDIPCFREWFIEPSQNHKIKKFFVDNLPQLEADECLFERVYNVKHFRGLDIYQEVNYLLAKKAIALGYKWVVGCIPLNNTLSLRAAQRLGVNPHKLQVTKWRFFIRKTVYEDIPVKLKTQNQWLFKKAC